MYSEDISSSSPTLRGCLRRIFSYIPEKRKNVFLYLQAFMICAAIFETITLYIIAIFASSVIDSDAALQSSYVQSALSLVGIDQGLDATQIILLFGAAIIVLVPFKNALRLLVLYKANKFSTEVEMRIGKSLLFRLLNSRYQWILKRNSADLIYAVEWRKFVGRSFLSSLLTIINDVVVSVILFLTLLVMQPVVTLIALFAFGSTAAFIYLRLKRNVDEKARNCCKMERKINKEATRSVHGIKDVKIASVEDEFIDHFTKDASYLSFLYAQMQFYAQLPSLVLESLGFSLLSGLVCFMLLVMEMPLAEVTAILALFAITAWRVLPAINRIIAALTRMRASFPYIVSVLNLLDELSPQVEKLITRNSEEDVYTFTRSISFENVRFAYDEAMILKDVTFSIYSGESVGIVGPSGSGKSTLVDVMIGLLPPTGGVVALDGKPLQTGFGRSGWMDNFGYVSQSPYIFDGSLVDNVAFGVSKERIDRDKVYDSCKKAAIDYLDDLPEGIDSQIGERGICLSGGQQQRIAIARALYRDPKILIFDEATSALDGSTEKIIQSTIQALRQDQTIVIVAHRLATVQDCDKIIWIEKGVVKMIGTPEDVLSSYELRMKSHYDDFAAQC